MILENSIAPVTEEVDREKETARKLDFLVEITQTCLALGITGVMAYLAIKGLKNEDVSNSFFLIVGFYFGKQFKDRAVGLSIRAVEYIKKND